MARFNRFGATYSQIVSMYPGSVLTDYDAGGANGQVNIESVLDRMSREVASALTPECYKQMTEVEAQLAVRGATDGQTTFSLGLTPIIAGTLHIWRYPSLASLMPGATYAQSGIPTIGDWAYRKPTVGFLEVPATNYSVVAATGAVTLAGISLTLGERVFATYDVDVSAAAFSLPSLQDLVLLGTAAELGERLYSDGQTIWTLVQEYKSRYRGAFAQTDSGLLVKAFAGNWIPDELRALTYWTPVERASTEVASVRVYRG